MAQQAATVAEAATATLTTDPLPASATSGASDCLVIVKRTPTQQIASLDPASCKGKLIWLDIKRGDVLLVSYGITTDNQVITTGDVEISREDGGLIVREIGAAGTHGVVVWST
ncbi:hypothetical protein DKM44_05880 [Deinococcus irradiatisoli]|uniref:Uncharacterized protein n=1 Tax=Deinococcus irradiatisoli TaxID=2202254 RepID=A0A2Z3JH26_9DEIO|nr:hypothetical protein DKM44_05880 [Deinococcus irradiatisoli]